MDRRWLPIAALLLCACCLLCCAAFAEEFLVVDDSDEEAGIMTFPPPTPSPTPTPAPTPTPTPGPLDALTVVTFGSYEQDGDESDGAEPIEWYVIARDGRYGLLLSRYALECRAYEPSYGSTSWEESPLRHWLNSTFVRGSFTQREKAAIRRVSVRNGRDQDLWDTRASTVYTRDDVFLLSYKEATGTYFVREELLLCLPTAHALTRGAIAHDEEGHCWWWSRSPGHKAFEATVFLEDGSVEYCDVNNTYVGVRPAMWVDLTNSLFAGMLE